MQREKVQEEGLFPKCYCWKCSPSTRWFGGFGSLVWVTRSPWPCDPSSAMHQKLLKGASILKIQSVGKPLPFRTISADHSDLCSCTSHWEDFVAFQKALSFYSRILWCPVQTELPCRNFIMSRYGGLLPLIAVVANLYLPKKNLFLPSKAPPCEIQPAELDLLSMVTFSGYMWLWNIFFLRSLERCGKFLRATPAKAWAVQLWKLVSSEEATNFFKGLILSS